MPADDVWVVANHREEQMSPVRVGQRDEITAQVQLLASVGRLTAEDLHLDVVRFDPLSHYGVVRDKWFGARPPP